MIPAQGQYDVPFNKIESSLQAWATEALDLVHGAAGDPEGKMTLSEVDWSDPRSIQAMLIRARTRSDRVAELLAKATQARHRARRAQSSAQFAAEIAFDEATNKNATSTKRLEFATREERNAAANIESLEQKRIAHFSERTTDIAVEVHEVITQTHWHLEGIRKDLRAALHELQFESSLER